MKDVRTHGRECATECQSWVRGMTERGPCKSLIMPRNVGSQREVRGWTKGQRLLRRRLGADIQHVKPRGMSSPSSLVLPLSLGLGVRDARNGREWRKGGFLSLVLSRGLRAMVSSRRSLTRKERTE
jgi:hypothetical protein